MSALQQLKARKKIVIRYEASYIVLYSLNDYVIYLGKEPWKCIM